MEKKDDNYPNEISRSKANENTIIAIYQAGYSTITVKSVFGTDFPYSDLLCRILKQKLNTTSLS